MNQLLAAVPMSSVREVLIRPPISELPLTPGCLKGLLNFRGEVVPVLHLDSFLEGAESQFDSTRDRVVVTQTPAGPIGLSVDQVDRIQIESPAPSNELVTTMTQSDPPVLFVHLDQLEKHLHQEFDNTALAPASL
ncbi:MAG: chemotaxis protein CheW [Verrucomicrobiota bacterium]